MPSKFIFLRAQMSFNADKKANGNAAFEKYSSLAFD